MDGNNWRPDQAEPNMVEASDWRTQLQDDSRQRIVNKIMDILKRHLPVSGPEGLVELKKIAVRFEEKIYTSATSQSDYLRKISLKMLTMETKSQNTGVTNSLAPNPQNPTDPDLQQGQHQLQQQQRLLGQQNSLSNMQQQQQQQLLGQQNNISNLNQQQLGSQIGVGLQQQQLIGAQSGVSNMQSSLHLLSHQAKVGGQQQTAQGSSTMMQIPGQQSQSQPLQQQLMPQFQSLPAQFQQQLGLQHQSNPLQRDMQQRLNSSGIPPQNVIEQKQIQSQRMLPEASSTSIDSTSQTGHANTADWQEEAYQKIKAMKEMYLPDLNEMYQKVLLKFQQHDSLEQLPKEQIERLQMMKVFLERAIAFLQASKSNIPAGHGDKMGSYEEQIVNFLSSHRG